MASFIISERAKKDITDIWNYTVSEWSEEQAIRYYNGLLDTCERIASNPEITGRSYDEVRPDNSRPSHFYPDGTEQAGPP